MSATFLVAGIFCLFNKHLAHHNTLYLSIQCASFLHLLQTLISFKSVDIFEIIKYYFTVYMLCMFSFTRHALINPFITLGN